MGKRKIALYHAFHTSLPIMAGYGFLGLTYGIYMHEQYFRTDYLGAVPHNIQCRPFHHPKHGYHPYISHPQKKKESSRNMNVADEKQHSCGMFWFMLGWLGLLVCWFMLGLFCLLNPSNSRGLKKRQVLMLLLFLLKNGQIPPMQLV